MHYFEVDQLFSHTEMDEDLVVGQIGFDILSDEWKRLTQSREEEVDSIR